MSERAECKRIEGKYWELIKVWPLECRQVQAMVAEEDDDDVSIGKNNSSNYTLFRVKILNIIVNHFKTFLI